MSTHSCVIAPHLKDSLSVTDKYGRMFPDLPCPETDENILLTLGKSVMGAAARTSDGAAIDNPRIPAGFTILGQFIAHDITADRSLLLHHARLNELRNFRSPRLDLESVYSAGPGGSPYLYDLDDPDKFLLGVDDRGEFNDLPLRSGASSGTALIEGYQTAIFACAGFAIAAALIAILIIREHECTQSLANPSLAEHCHSARPFAIHIPHVALRHSSTSVSSEIER